LVVIWSLACSPSRRAPVGGAEREIRLPWAGAVWQPAAVRAGAGRL